MYKITKTQILAVISLVCVFPGNGCAHKKAGRAQEGAITKMGHHQSEIESHKEQMRAKAARVKCEQEKSCE